MLYIICFVGNHDWVGNDFAVNAGVGLVIMMRNNLNNRGVTILDQAKAAFDRDWRSRYAKSLQGAKDQNNKYRGLQKAEIHLETKEDYKWKYPLSVWALNVFLYMHQKPEYYQICTGLKSRPITRHWTVDCWSMFCSMNVNAIQYIIKTSHKLYNSYA